MKRAVIVLAAWALILSGCGQTKDPFVGTWQAVGFSPGNGYTISKVSGAYRITTVAHFKPLPGYSFPCSRRGDDGFNSCGALLDGGREPACITAPRPDLASVDGSSLPAASP